MTGEIRPLPTAEEREEKVLRMRLGWHSTIYVARLPGKLAVARMRERGEVIVREGQGQDEGLYIVQATPRLGSPIGRELEA